MPGAWVDPWSLTLVYKTSRKVLGLLDSKSSMLNLYAAARAILLEDGQDPRCVLGPLDVFQGILA
jgi:hypothetical protein